MRYQPKRDEGVALDEAQEPPHDDERDDRRHERSQHDHAPRRVLGARSLQVLVDRKGARREHRGNAEEEGEFRRGRPREADGHREQDGRTGARRAGKDGGEDLRHRHDDSDAPGHLRVAGPLGHRPLDDQDEDAAHTVAQAMGQRSFGSSKPSFRAISTPAIVRTKATASFPR